MSIGSQLKQARQKMGMSLQEASVNTRIQEKYLDALENDNFSLLPNVLYLKDFLKSYAQVLGLDPNAVMSQLQQESLEKEKQVIVLKSKELPPVRTEKYFKKSIALIIAIIVIIGLFISFLSLFHRKTSGVKRLKANNQASRKVIPLKPLKPAPLPTPAPKALQATRPVVLNLLIMAKRPCHLTLKADSTLLFDGFLLAGTTDQWQAKKMFELNISDGSAVELVVNGKKTGPIAKGAKRDIFITKDGIRRK